MGMVWVWAAGVMVLLELKTKQSVSISQRHVYYMFEEIVLIRGLFFVMIYCYNAIRVGVFVIQTMVYRKYN